MQTILKDEDKRGGSRRVDLVGTLVYIRRISRYLKGKHLRRVGRRRIGI